MSRPPTSCPETQNRGAPTSPLFGLHLAHLPLNADAKASRPQEARPLTNLEAEPRKAWAWLLPSACPSLGMVCESPGFRCAEVCISQSSRQCPTMPKYGRDLPWYRATSAKTSGSLAEGGAVIVNFK